MPFGRFMLVIGVLSGAGVQASEPRSPFEPPPGLLLQGPSKKAKTKAKPESQSKRPDVATAEKTPKAVSPAPAFPGEDAEPAAVEPPSAVAQPTSGPLSSPIARTARRNSSKPGPYPTAFLESRLARFWADVKSRPVRVHGGPAIEMKSAANKQDWLHETYARNMVDASRIGYMLSDKLMVAEVFRRELGRDYDRFFPKTLGLKQFLEKRKLVREDGRLKVDPDVVEQALADEFPFGYVVRPAVGVAPRETERGLFARSDQLVAELFDEHSVIYSPSSYRHPIKSHILEGAASGEAIVIQEDVVLRADVHKRLKARNYVEARVHVYEARVVPDASPEKWVMSRRPTEEQQRRAEAFVGEMLSRLSAPLLSRQAWSLDVAAFDNGDLRVLDVVTNRGRKSAWSSYLDQPHVIGAYVRFWEERYGVAYSGASGALLRRNLANYFPYWGKRIETANAPWKKALALLPPIP